MDIKEGSKTQVPMAQGTMSQKIGKALEDIDETSKRCPIWVGCNQYLRLDYVQRLLLEILDEGDEGK